jgi:2,4-dienoyl-CoA reductase-like NADH-dependent reductase (Old Yellow Enzyme family)
MLDLVNDGSTLPEVIELAQAIEAAGATLINTGIGWHEARIPTIATPVPRGAFSWVTRKLKGAVSIPWSPLTASTIRRSRMRSSPAATPIWCQWPARFWPTANSFQSAKRARR